MRISINKNTQHLKSPKNQNRRAALGRPAMKLLGASKSLYYGPHGRLAPLLNLLPTKDSLYLLTYRQTSYRQAALVCDSSLDISGGLQHMFYVCELSF